MTEENLNQDHFISLWLKQTCWTKLWYWY